MQSNKLKSFTLSELLVVMIITVIVVGIAFSVLSLVQKQIHGIEKNFSKTTEMALLEQRLWQDFNQHNSIIYQNHKLSLLSDIDTITYSFNPDFTLRKNDTIHLALSIEKLYYLGKEVKTGTVDAISLSGNKEVPDHTIFVTSKNDATSFINQNGF